MAILHLITQYTPARGDVVDIPLYFKSAGQEITKGSFRPFLVLSDIDFNKSHLFIVCPITNNTSPHPFKIPVPHGHHVTGAVLSHQIHTLDWVARNVKKRDVLPHTTVDKVAQIVKHIF